MKALLFARQSYFPHIFRTLQGSPGSKHSAVIATQLEVMLGFGNVLNN